MKDVPVTLPPGRDRLATRPLASGSPTLTITIGIVRDACRTAITFCAAGATMTSTWRRTSSAARAGSRSYRPSEDRCSIRRFRPST
jgi:hypothetical protein